VEGDLVALALDAGRGDQPLPLDGDRLGAGVPHGVGHGLDVLLVHHQVVGVALVGQA
jgi:hypothetical protein